MLFNQLFEYHGSRFVHLHFFLLRGQFVLMNKYFSNPHIMPKGEAVSMLLLFMEAI
jgi:hypothetical protein